MMRLGRELPERAPSSSRKVDSYLVRLPSRYNALGRRVRRLPKDATGFPSLLPTDGVVANPHSQYKLINIHLQSDLKD
jgi:hypothetical protein